MLENITTDEVIDRCLAAASFCIELGNQRWVNNFMKAEFREIAREIAHWELSGETKAGLFLLPMEEELISRHGKQIGQMLYSDFVEAFWLQTWTDIPLDLEKLGRTVETTTEWNREFVSDRTLRQMVAERDYGSNYSNN